MKRRIDIDILKGILILLVVVGHQAPAPISTVIYWFHMPSFFIISGLLHKEEVISFGGYAKKKVKSLLIPYVVYCALIVLIIERNPKDFLFDILGGGSRYTYGVYWFVPALFITEMVFFLINKVVEKSNKKVIIIAVLAIALIVISSLYSLFFYSNLEGDYTGWPMKYQVPWSLDVCLMSLGYYSLGYVFKKISENDKVKLLLYIGFSAFLLCIVGGATGFLSYKFDMKTVQYSNWGLNIVLPLCGFAFCFIIAKWIAQIPGVRTFFSSLGMESMAIMFLHGQFLVLIGKIFKEESKPHWTICVVIATLFSFATIKAFRWVKGVLVKRWK